MAKRVVIAMSGGVDSSVTAYLLKAEGYEVIGITMNLVESICQIEKSNICCSLQAFNDAQYVADKLSIEHYIVDYKSEFEQEVIGYFLSAYLSGKTPNPCIICNTKIKFGLLLDKAKTLGAEYLATGHYARISEVFADEKNRYVIKKGIDLSRDQSYFLYGLSQYQLKHTVMPLGTYTKKEVRQIAAELCLKVYNKPESQEICFIPNDNYQGFIQKMVGKSLQPGPILNKEGKILGEHQGIALFTIGQRKGLRIAIGKPQYVCAIDPERNAIIVADESELYSQTLIVKGLNWVGIEELVNEMVVTAKIRYLHKGGEAVISPLPEKRCLVKFFDPQRAITPGQAVVFYRDDLLIGGGWIATPGGSGGSKNISRKER